MTTHLRLFVVAVVVVAVVRLNASVDLNLSWRGDTKGGNLGARCAKTRPRWFSFTRTKIKPCFNTEPRLLAASPLRRDTPKINHKFTSQLPLWNCVRLQIPYQIIDRILFFPLFLFFFSTGPHFQVLCIAYLSAWEDLDEFSFFVPFLSLSFCEFVSEVSSCLLCHVTGTAVWIFASHLSSLTGSRLGGVGAGGVPVKGISQPSPRWSAQCTSFPNSFFYFFYFSLYFQQRLQRWHAGGIRNFYVRKKKKKKKSSPAFMWGSTTQVQHADVSIPRLCLAALFISPLPRDVVKRAALACRTVERVFQTEKCHVLINRPGKSWHFLLHFIYFIFIFLALATGEVRSTGWKRTLSNYAAPQHQLPESHYI